jgi:hypothetical protein
MSATNRSRLSYAAESALGVIPTDPDFKTMRVTSNSFANEPRTITTNEIRPDRQVTDLILVGAQSGGEVGVELSFGGLDDFLEAGLQGTWASKPSLTADAIATDVVDVDAGGAAFVTGHLVRGTGFAQDNFLARVASSTATAITLETGIAEDEATPPETALVRVVGFQGAEGDLETSVTGGNALVSTVLDFTTLGLVVGEWIKIGGDGTNSFSVDALNGRARIADIDENRLSLDIVPAGWASNAGAGRSVQVFCGDVLRNASTQRSYTVEQVQEDRSTFEWFTGQQVNTVSLQARTEQILTGSVGFIGQGGQNGTAAKANTTYIAAPDGQILNASSNVARIAQGGSLITGPNWVQELSIEINNNLERENAIGSLAAVNVRTGEFMVTGTINTYFGNLDILNAVIANTETSFDLHIGRPDGERPHMTFDMPRIKFSAGAAPVQGKNQSRVVQGSYQALREPTLDYTMQVIRWHYLPAA